MHKLKRMPKETAAIGDMEDFLWYITYSCNGEFYSKILEPARLKALPFFLFRQWFVQRAAAEALQVNSYELKAERL